MIRIPTITEIADTIDNCAEAFDRLRRVAICRDNDCRPTIEAHNNHYRLPVTVDGAPYTLYLLFEADDERRMAIARACRATRSSDNRAAVIADFLPHEVRVHSSTGATYPLDIVIERQHPTLFSVIKECASRNDTEQLRRHIELLELVATSMEESALYHTNPSLDNICIDSRGELRLRSYPLYAHEAPIESRRGLMRSALTLYLLGCMLCSGQRLDICSPLHTHHINTLAQGLSDKIPSERRVAEIITTLSAESIDSATLHSQLYLLAILPYESKIGERLNQIITIEPIK